MNRETVSESPPGAACTTSFTSWDGYGPACRSQPECRQASAVNAINPKAEKAAEPERRHASGRIVEISARKRLGEVEFMPDAVDRTGSLQPGDLETRGAFEMAGATVICLTYQTCRCVLSTTEPVSTRPLNPSPRNFRRSKP